MNKLERFWTKVEKVAWKHADKKARNYVLNTLDTLLDVTICPHTIQLCSDKESGCKSPSECKYKAHINCCCPTDIKIPRKDLRWLYSQQHKRTEKSDMMIAGVDTVESKRQNKAEKRSEAALEAQVRKRIKIATEENSRIDQQDLDTILENELPEIKKSSVQQVVQSNTDTFIPSKRHLKAEEESSIKLVDWLLHERLGDLSHQVIQYLDRPKPKRNMMPVPNTAKASLRCGVSAAATATIATEFLKDLITAGVLEPKMAYLACDPSKLERARKQVMAQATEMDKQAYAHEKIEGLSYDGRKDKRTRAMVTDSYGKTRMRMVKEEHISVTEEPKGRYLSHFVPDQPSHKEKPALKVAQSLYHLLEQHDSLDSIKYLGGDSTNTNTGWKGGTHAYLEKLLGRKLYWGICNIHTHELPLRHLISTLDGPTCSDEGFSGEVCSLLSKVDQMPYNPDFKKLSGGETLIEIPDDILNSMSTTQKNCYKLVGGINAGSLPEEMQEMLCDLLNHARWNSTGERLAFLWTRKHGLTGHNLKVLELLVKFCIEYYFKIYFDIKVKHCLQDGPYHILTQLRILKTQPKCVRDAITTSELVPGTPIQNVYLYHSWQALILKTEVLLWTKY